MARRCGIVEPPSPYDALIASWRFRDGNVNPNYGAFPMTFTRPGAGTATRCNSQGLIELVDVDVPRLDYDPVTLAIIGYLNEPPKSNRFLHYNDATQATWVKTGVTVTANDVAAPNGVVEADKLTQGSGASDGFKQAITFASNQIHAVSHFLRYSDVAWVCLDVYETAAPANFVRAWFNLQTGAVGAVANGGTGTGATAWLEPYPAREFFRPILVGAVNNAATAVTCELYAVTGDASTTRAAGSYWWWGSQAETNEAATSVTPTGAATAARGAEVLSVLLSSIPGFNAAEGGLVLRAVANGGDIAGAHQYGVSLSDGTANEVVALRRNTSENANVTVIDGGATQVNSGSVAWTRKTAKKIAFGWKANDFGTSIEGGAIIPDTGGTVPTVTGLYVARVHASDAETFGGWITGIDLFSRRPTDTELRAL